jgi:deazaflavin-dependent oxidoreductase (nitroreductase family)
VTNRYVDADPVRRLIRRATTSRPLAWLSARVLHRIDGVVVRATKGRGTFSGWVSGLPVVLLTTTGARSGLARTTPVLGIPDDDALIVLAANFGKTTHPSWFHNVRATPAVSVAVDGVTREYDAVVLAGAERDRWFERAVELNPGWLRYRRWAGERAIPVVRLQPAAA